ncbi:MAG: hypothetical protein WCR56_05750 [Bacilli bacterium]|jgi:hypothetical protein
MKNISKQEWIVLLSYSLLAILATIIVVFLKLYGFAVFIGIPIAFFIPIVLTQVYTPADVSKHIAKEVILIVLRYVFMILSCLIPALIWYLVPWIKESVNAFAILIPPSEILVLYIISIIFTYFNAGNEEKNTNKKE